MTDAVFVINVKNLLSFALVANITLVIDASCIVPGARVVVHSSRH